MFLIASYSESSLAKQGLNKAKSNLGSLFSMSGVSKEIEFMFLSLKQCLYERHKRKKGCLYVFMVVNPLCCDIFRQKKTHFFLIYSCFLPLSSCYHLNIYSKEFRNRT